MIKAVLLDLDDTLIQTPARGFAIRYLAGIAGMLRKLAPFAISDILQIMRIAGQATVSNLDPLRTNQDVFRACVAYNLGLPVETLAEVVEIYHDQEYEQLAEAVQPVAGAAALVERLLKAGFAIVIATNPLFPLRPIKMRMAWGGLSPDLPYALITGMDEMHFTKPNPHYYEEILARVGVEPDEAIMVGDDIENDILAAARTGMHTFWVEGGKQREGVKAASYSSKGTLGDFAAFVESGWLNTLTAPPLRLGSEQVTPRMIADAAALFSMVNSAEDRFWHMHPDPAEWSPLEVVCHLRDSERDVQRPRLHRIAAEDNPFIPATPSPLGPGERDLSGENPFAAAQEFWRERQQTLKFLANLGPEDWPRPARHSIFGPTSLLEMALFTTRHDRLHLTQLCQTVGRCHEL